MISNKPNKFNKKNPKIFNILSINQQKDQC